MRRERESPFDDTPPKPRQSAGSASAQSAAPDPPTYLPKSLRPNPRPTAPIAHPHSNAARTASPTATTPNPAHNPHNWFQPVAPDSAPSNPAAIHPRGAHRGHARYRAICLPLPCSSIVIRTRAAPITPPRTCKSHRS